MAETVPGQQNQSEAPKPAEQQQSSTVQKTVSEQIQDFIQKNAEHFDVVEKEIEKNQSIKSKQAEISEATLNRATRDILWVIKNNQSNPTSLNKLPTITRKIISEISQGDMSEKSTPILYCLLKHSQDPAQLDNVGMTSNAVREIYQLRYLDGAVAKQVLKPLLAKLTELGVDKSSTLMQEIEAYISPAVDQQKLQQQKAESDRLRQVRSKMLQKISGVGLSGDKRRLVEMQIRSQLAEEIKNGSMTEERLQEVVNLRLQQESASVQSDIASSFNDITAYKNGNDPRALEENILKFQKKLADMQSQGIISEAAKEGLERSLEELTPYLERMQSQSERITSDELLRHVKQTLPHLPQRLENILGSIADVHAFENHIFNAIDPSTGAKLYVNNGVLNWDVFYQDVRDIFEEILSVADSKPNQFFQDAFSPMYEGHLYNTLLKTFSGLSARLAASPDSKLATQQVKYKEIVVDPNPGETSTQGTPRTELFRQTEITKNFHDALGYHLVNDMTMLLNTKESLHNIDSICTLGLGWEQLSQYADRVNGKSIDWVFQTDSDMHIAYNMYVQSLETTVSSNGRIITASFGQRDSTLNLDSTERAAYYKLYSYLKKNHSDWNDAMIKKRAIQKIRTSSAIAKGVTGEFWNKVLAARMPIGQAKGKDGEGRDVFVIATPYVGTGQFGYEKMIAQLDLDLLLQRFGLPKYYNNLRHVFRPRNIQHGAAPDVYSKEGSYDHGDVYKWAKKDEDAFFAGREDDLADFDDGKIFLYDNLRTTCVGLFARSGWRFIEQKALFKYKKDASGKVDNTKIDHIETLKHLQRTGGHLIKMYIDDFKPEDFAKLSAAEMQVLCGVNRTYTQMSESEKGKLGKEALYSRLLFGHYAAIAPSKMLKFEMRRWTPKKENMLQDDLLSYMKGKYAGMNISYDDGVLYTHAYKMYISAMELAETSVWDAVKDKNHDRIPPYEFTTRHIQEHEKELREFYRQYKSTEVGEYEREQGEKIRIFETEEQFLEMLKGMTGQLRSSIQRDDRWNRQDHSRKGAKKEKLEDRFAYFLNKDMANMKAFIGGDDFDFSNFFMSAGGGRVAGRFMGETFGVTSKMNPALSKFFMTELPNFSKGEYEDNHKLAEAVKKHFVPIISDIHASIANMDKGQADGYVVEMMVFMGRILGKDRQFRMKGVGPVFDWWWRQMYPTSQVNINQDFLRNLSNRPTTALDSDQMLEMFHVIGNSVNISANEEIPDHYEDVKVFGKKVGSRRVNKGEKIVPRTIKIGGKEIAIPFMYKKTIEHGKGHPWTIEDAEIAEGLVGWPRWKESILPISIIMGLLVVLAMMKMALDKNKKK